MEVRGQLFKIVVVATMLMIVGVLSYFAFFATEDDSSNPTPGGTALSTTPEQEPYTTLNGEPVTLTLEGTQHTLVYSWASWCASCAEDLIQLNEWVGAEGQGSSVKVIAINRAETSFVANQFLETLPDLSQLEIILDPSDRLFSAIEGYAMPEYVLYDQLGNELYAGRAALNLTAIEEIMQID